MRKLKTVVKLSILPVACLACVMWVAAFVMIGAEMPKHNVGLIALTVFAGAALLLPWLIMVMAIVKRIGGTADAAKTPGPGSEGIQRQSE